MNTKFFSAASRKFYNVKRNCRYMYCGIVPDKAIKLWLASFFMGCLGKMQDGFQPKIAQETRYR